MNKLFKSLLICLMLVASVNPIRAEEPNEAESPELESFETSEEISIEDYVDFNAVSFNGNEHNEASNEIVVDGDGHILAAHDFELSNADALLHNESVVKGVLPESYDLRTYGRVTSVKNQDPYGTCWAFAIIASAESNAITKGYDDSNIDLSELHLAYYTFNNKGAADALNLIKYDYNYSTSAYINYYGLLNLGGNSYVGTVGAASGIGLVDESVLKYSNADKVNNKKVTPSKSNTYKSSYLITDTHYLSNEATERDTVKNYIMNNGAVTTMYHAAETYAENEAFYNSQYYAYYCYSASYSANHAVTVVGWDDNFDKSKFKSTPSNNGAWLIKNSWGTEEFGDAGYFWISYEDKSMNGFVGVEVSQNTSDNHIYQYDGTGSFVNGYWYTTYIDDFKFANVYTTTRNEELNMVGYYTGQAETTTKISIYVNPSKTNPTSGTLVYSNSFYEEDSGYHTAQINPVVLKKGTKYSVVIQYLSTTSSAFGTMFDANDYYGWINFSDSRKSGQSFLTSDGGRTWLDGAKTRLDNGTIYYGITNRIKVYTNSRTTSAPKVSTVQDNLEHATIYFTSGKCDYYVVEKSTNSKFKKGTVLQTQVDYLDGYLADDQVELGKTYYYRVKAVNDAAYGSDFSSSYSKTIAFKINVPKVEINSASVVNNVQIQVDWTPHAYADGYEVYVSTDKKKYKRVATCIGAETSSYAYDGAANKKTYYFYVKAYKDYNGKRYYSAASAVKSNKITIAAPEMAFISVTNPGVIYLACYQHPLASENNTTVTYDFYRSTSAKSGYKKIGSSDTDSYVDNTAALNKTYYYKVVAVIEYNGAKHASAMSVSYLKGKSTFTTPTLFTVANDGAGITIKWGATSETITYQIQRTTDSKFKKGIVTTEVEWNPSDHMMNIMNGDPFAAEYHDETVVNGKTYYYRVRAVYHNPDTGRDVYSSFTSVKKIKAVLY